MGACESGAGSLDGRRRMRGSGGLSARVANRYVKVGFAAFVNDVEILLRVFIENETGIVQGRESMTRTFQGSRSTTKSDPSNENQG